MAAAAAAAAIGAARPARRLPLAQLLLVLLLLVAAMPARAQKPNPRMALPPDVDPDKKINVQPGYELKPYDVPFGERFKVSFKYYDTPSEPLLYWRKPVFKVACNYSSNAYFTSNVALHPYWFREFGLLRQCRQDVCLSIWTEDHSHDLMWKVTDVCDPAICTDPFTVRVEEYKASYLWYHREGPRPAKQAYAYFSPCWADGLRQDLYANEVPGPKLLNSRHWMISKMYAQHKLNQEHNKKRGRPVRQLGALVRPWATIYRGQLKDFRPEDYPPGSHRRVIEEYQRKLKASG